MFYRSLMSSFLAVLCCIAGPVVAQQAEINFEKFTLDNGLEVIFHLDTSDPVTAVALTFHVGSAREVTGRTGFAHLFEHLLFLESENLGRGGLDRLSSRVGGSGANGSTSRDRTNYFQTVPNDALERMLWAEAEKLGYFINTVTEPVLQKEKQVVKNEKRQGVDNRPYGHTQYVIDKNLYPADHPYSWQVIGSLEDLQNATLDDVKNFYNTWYVPNNATLVVAGDFDFEQAREWVHQYFDEIPAGNAIEPLTPRPETLDETMLLSWEDNFAQLPELTMVWPGVRVYQPDSYALQIIMALLTEGRSAPLYQVLVEEQELTNNIRFGAYDSEIAGQLQLQVRAFPGTDLSVVRSAIMDGFARFESSGFTADDLERIKAGIETGFYDNLSSVLGKAFQLAQYNIFADDPGYINEELDKYLEVSEEDIWRVYEQYIKAKPYIATSFIPKGESNLAMPGSRAATVVEEQIVAEGRGESFELSGESAEYIRTPSAFDRSVEPSAGPAPELKIPVIWTLTAANEMGIYGIETAELPLVEFSLDINGGLLLDDPGKVGVANLVATMLNRGTANRTPAELEAAIEQLGAVLQVSAGREGIRVSGRTLSSRFDETMALMTEMLLEPRWDSSEFSLAKQAVLGELAEQQAEPNAVADNLFNTLLYGEANILSYNLLGTVASVGDIRLQDLQTWYAANLVPSLADFHITGDVSAADVESAIADLVNGWDNRAVTVPDPIFPAPREDAVVYLYDVPGARQSVLRVGNLALAATDEDYWPASVMNYILGGGGFASRLTQELREGKGYTYGIRSRFEGSVYAGPFQISSGVRTNITLEALESVIEILSEYPATFSETDLATTKSFLLASNARRFETFAAKLDMLRDISTYGYANDYVLAQEAFVESVAIYDIRTLAQRYADPGKLIYLVVGDAATQRERLEALGLPVVSLN